MPRHNQEERDFYVECNDHDTTARFEPVLGDEIRTNHQAEDI